MKTAEEITQQLRDNIEPLIEKLGGLYYAYYNADSDELRDAYGHMIVKTVVFNSKKFWVKPFLWGIFEMYDRTKYSIRGHSAADLLSGRVQLLCEEYNLTDPANNSRKKAIRMTIGKFMKMVERRLGKKKEETPAELN